MNDKRPKSLAILLTAGFAILNYYGLFPVLGWDQGAAFIIGIICVVMSAFVRFGEKDTDDKGIAQRMLQDDYREFIDSRNSFGEDNRLPQVFARQRRLFADIYGMTLTASTHGRFLKEDAQRVQTLSREVVQAMEEVSKGNAHVAGLIEEITVQTGHANQFIHEIGSDVSRISIHAAEAEALAGDGKRSLEAQSATVEGSLKTFDSIKEVVSSLENAALEIGTIAGTITAIASETNLLALNAAIEAARAGEAGRGFAVVADEIRKLAGNTNEATVRVGNLIERVRNEVAAIVDVVGEGHRQTQSQAQTIAEGGKVFEAIAESVVGIARELSGISVKSEELINFSEAIHRAIENIAAVSQQTAAGAQEVNASAADQSGAMEVINERLTDYSAKAQDITKKLSGVKYVRMAQSEYEEHILQVEILRQSIGAELGIAVEGIRIPIEELFHSMAEGTTDATVAPWMPSGKAMYETHASELEALGVNMTGCLRGIAVPTYVDINRIEEMKGKELRFGGTLYSCYRTSPLGGLATESVPLYGLNMKLEYCSEDQLIAALKKRTDKNEWVAITGWQPHAMVKEFNLKFLADSKGIFGPENRCETFINRKAMTEMPELKRFLQGFKLDVRGINDALVRVGAGMSMEDAAAEYLKAYGKR